MYEIHSEDVYNGSPIQLLSAAYPDYEWLPWRFKKLPNNYILTTNDKETIINFLKKTIGIKEKKDWENVNYVVE